MTATEPPAATTDISKVAELLRRHQQLKRRSDAAVPLSRQWWLMLVAEPFAGFNCTRSGASDPVEVPGEFVVEAVVV